MEIWRFAIRSVMAHKMRSLLTMLGIIIGVAAVVIIMGLGNGLKKSFLDGFAGNKKEIQLYFQADEDQLEGTEAALSGIYSQNNHTIKSEWLEEISKNTVGIDGYYVTNGSSAKISNKNKKMDNAMITGVNLSYFKFKKVKMLAGRKLQEADYMNFSRVVVIDSVVSEKLFDSYDEALNKVIQVGDKDYLVVGVYKPEKSSISGYGLNGGVMMANTQVALEYHTEEASQIFFHVKDIKKVDQLGVEAGNQLTILSNVKGGKYKAVDVSEILESVNKQFNIMTAIIGSIAGISLLVGGIGVMNIMLVSVTERTREIGLRKALGATRGKILVQFLIESIVLTALGGFIGLGLAFVLIPAAGQSMNVTAGVSLDVAFISILFSASIGIIFGILPANKASKLNPIEALRYE